MEEYSQMNTNPVEISSAQIAETIRLLRDAGRQECILLWLGHREQGLQRIVEVYRPLQEADRDYFVIPREGMAALMKRLRTLGLYVVSQVHTHPGHAFHSRADDKWAIVRHTGALSIVLPFFAESTTVENFPQEAAVFQLDSHNRWNEVANENVREQLRVTP
jgi:proteasome lid subunit RPN8/RPN11